MRRLPLQYNNIVFCQGLYTIGQKPLEYGYFMDRQVQQIKDRTNIADVVGTYVQLRRAGRTFVGKCPFHKERTPSFHVSPERGTYKCFGCGEGGDVFSFIQKMDGIDFPTALRQLAERAGVKLDPQRFRQKLPQEREKEERLREVCEEAVKFFEGELAKHQDIREYLKTRGVHSDTIAAWRLGYAPASWKSLCIYLKDKGFNSDEIVETGFALKSEKKPGEIFDRFRGRIIFPLFDVAGQPIAVSGRFFPAQGGSASGGEDEDREPAKYINSPETPIFKKSRVLYGLNRARGAIRKADCILLVEGQFDLILAHQAGLPFAVALSGTALTPEHLSILSRLSKRLVLALDADEAGVRAGLKSALMATAAGFDVKVPTFLPGKDPADLARENPELLKAAVRTSRTAVEFFLDVLRAGARDERAYKKLVESNVLPLVTSMGSRIEQEHFVALIAGRLGVSTEAVREEVARHKTRAVPAEPSLPEAQIQNIDSLLTPPQKKAGMLVFHFGEESEVAQKLRALVGEPALARLKAELEPHAEELRLRFDAQVHEGTDEETIAADMLADLSRQVERDRVKAKFI